MDGHGQRESLSPESVDTKEEEIRRLRNALGTEKNKNKQLITVIEKRVLEYKKNSKYVYIYIYCIIDVIEIQFMLIFTYISVW